MQRLLALLAFVSLAVPASSQLEVDDYFGDHMVLQAGQSTWVFGKVAKPGMVVHVDLAKGGDWEKKFPRGGLVMATVDGEFAVELEAHPAGGPWSLRVQAGPHVEVFDDVWFGDVWLCSGQSNMEWPLERSNDAEAEIAAGNHPGIRLFQVQHRVAGMPASSTQGSWSLCSPESVRRFSAVGYHFGRELSGKLGRPIGLVQSTWGGTPAEAWTERSHLEATPEAAPLLERPPPSPQHGPSVLYNGMLASLRAVRFRGAIWYQGESNASRAEQYRALFPAMIRSWRDAFAAPELPFLFVQLANFRARHDVPGESDWAELREAQSMALALPHTGMAVTIDVGAADDIHPRDKRTVGERLALSALAGVYGRDVVASGPAFDGVALDGARATVSFAHADGLATSDGGAPTGFALAGEDRAFHWAEATIVDGTVVLSAAAVPAPLAVRYAWADNPACNLVNGAGLPASPFRSDDWPGVTAGRR